MPAKTPAFSFSGPDKINQIPAFPGREFVLKGRHAAEAQSDSLENCGVAQALQHVMVEAGRGWNKFFAVGQMPMLEQKLNVYRGGLKTGEVRITGPQRDDNIVADIVVGDAAAGDEVRDR